MQLAVWLSASIPERTLSISSVVMNTGIRLLTPGIKLLKKPNLRPSSSMKASRKLGRISPDLLSKRRGETPQASGLSPGPARLNNTFGAKKNAVNQTTQQCLP